MKTLALILLFALAWAVWNTPSDVENTRDNPDVTQSLAGEAR